MHLLDLEHLRDLTCDLSAENLLALSLMQPGALERLNVLDWDVSLAVPVSAAFWRHASQVATAVTVSARINLSGGEYESASGAEQLAACTPLSDCRVDAVANFAIVLEALCPRNCPKLERIYMFAPASVELSPLQNLTQLERLMLTLQSSAGNRAIKAIAGLAALLPTSLRKLNLKITHPVPSLLDVTLLASISCHCPQLTALNFASPCVTCDELASVEEAVRGLQLRLQLDCRVTITDAESLRLARNLPWRAQVSVLDVYRIW